MANSDSLCIDNPRAKVGVGLRHPHFNEVLQSADEVDFVEIHAENFYMDGGLALSFLDQLSAVRPISIHATGLGLGSRTAVPQATIAALRRLTERVDPLLVSDHAAFCWSGTDGNLHHSGDLLPVEFNPVSLTWLTRNIDRVQQAIGRQILIENLSSYLGPGVDTQAEYEFLQRACQQTGAALLVDINNLQVNSFNRGSTDLLRDISGVLDQIDPALVGEIHLAGCAPPATGELLIDDHSRPVSDIVWSAYEHALAVFGPVPTLVEWDTELPPWSVLIDEAMIAHGYMHEVCGQ